MSILEEVIEKYVSDNDDYVWECVAGNPSISNEFIRSNLDKPWRWSSIFIHRPDIFDDVKHLLMSNDRDWMVYQLWTYDIESLGNYLTELEEPLSPFEEWWMILNPNVTPEAIEKTLEENDERFNWNWGKISRLDSLTTDFLCKFIDKDWNWLDLSSNPRIPLEFIKKTLEEDPEGSIYKWDWRGIAKNPNLTSEFIDQYIDSFNGGCWIYLSGNRNLSMEFVEDSVINGSSEKFHWVWGSICRNKNFTIEVCERLLKKGIVFDSIQIVLNPNFTLEYCVNKLNININKTMLCNPNVSLEFIERYKDEFDDVAFWMNIVHNKFKDDPVLRYAKARKLQRWWKRMKTLKLIRRLDEEYAKFEAECYEDPGSYFYKKRLKEFENMV